ncbi:MAG: hypothetical protein ACI4CY_01010 [Candidatus Gastranaerophilaceae bacterium]
MEPISQNTGNNVFYGSQGRVACPPSDIAMYSADKDIDDRFVRKKDVATEYENTVSSKKRGQTFVNVLKYSAGVALFSGLILFIKKLIFK